MRIVLSFLVAICLAAPLAADTTASPFADTLDRENRHLSRIPAGRLEALLSIPPRGERRGRLSEIEYSRAWLSVQPKPTGDQQFECLAEALYFEARGETVKGQFAVAEVIMNRVASPRFPDTPCKVIHQGTGRKYQCQFTYTCDGIKEVIAEPRAYTRVAKVARAVLDGAPRRLTDGATYYHTKAVSPRWSRKFDRTATIGVHHFYRPPTRLSQN